MNFPGAGQDELSGGQVNGEQDVRLRFDVGRAEQPRYHAIMRWEEVRDRRSAVASPTKREVKGFGGAMPKP